MLFTTMYLPSFVFLANDIIIASRDSVCKLVSDFGVYSVICDAVVFDDSPCESMFICTVLFPVLS